jgi:hypothetical protein
MSSTMHNTDNRYCAGRVAHDHILAVDMHINFPIERTIGRIWRRRSHVYHITGSSRQTHLLRSRSVYAPPLVYKRESALIRTQVNKSIRFTRSTHRQGPGTRSNNFPSFLKQYNTQVDVGYYAPVARTTLNLSAFSVFIHPLIKHS